jgi:hypothetical protein
MPVDSWLAWPNRFRGDSSRIPASHIAVAWVWRNRAASCRQYESPGHLAGVRTSERRPHTTAAGSEACRALRRGTQMVSRLPAGAREERIGSLRLECVARGDQPPVRRDFCRAGVEIRAGILTGWPSRLCTMAFPTINHRCRSPPRQGHHPGAGEFTRAAPGSASSRAARVPISNAPQRYSCTANSGRTSRISASM